MIIVQCKSNSACLAHLSDGDYGRAGKTTVSHRNSVRITKELTKLLLAVEPEVANYNDNLTDHGYPEGCGSHG